MKTFYTQIRFTQIFSPVALCLIFAIVNLNAYSQQQLNFTTLSANGGLSSNTINDILKDRLGLMWFATEDGLDKFDGTNVTVYRYHTNDTNSLQSNEILALHEDKQGNLWVGTGGGSLSLYDREKDHFITFPALSTPGSINNNVILSLCSDRKNNIWIGNYMGLNLLDPVTKKITRFSADGRTPFYKTTICLFEDRKKRVWIGTSEGLYLYDPDTRTTKHFEHDPANPGSIGNNYILSITDDDLGRTWIGTAAGLSRKEANSDTFNNYYHDANNSASISQGGVNTLEIGDQNNLWIGTEHGLDILDPRSGAIKHVGFNQRKVQGLASRSIRSIYHDDQGIFWIGTFRGGINKYDKNLNLFNLVQSNPFDQQGLPSPIVSSFAEGRNGKVYVGTEYGGVALFEKASQSFKRLKLQSKRQGVDELVVLELNFTRNNELAVGTFGDGLFFMNPENGAYRQMMAGSGPADLPSNQIFSVTEDKSGRLWIGTNGAGIAVLNSEGKIIRRFVPNPKFEDDRALPINAYIRDIIEDHKGNFWIATHGGGVARLDATMSNFKIYNSANSHLPTDRIQAIHEDGYGNIWVASFGGGLGLLNRATNQFDVYSEKDGLANNTIYDLVDDGIGKLWMTTNQGISSFNISSKKFNNYTFHNGVQQNNFVHGAGMRASDGTLYFGGLNGFNYFNPENLVKNTHVPEVIFTDLKVSNRSVSPSADGPLQENMSVTQEINLDYKQNFALSFVGLNYTAPQQNQYAYKLEGFDKDWIYAGNSNTASYTNLDPGTYTFKVKASNNDGVWNEEGSSIKIIVHPPFWRTPFAYFIYIITFIGLLAYSRHRALKRVKLKYEREQERIILDQERKATERERELDRQKIKFLTNLSHEFRTPISLILGPVDGMLDQENDRHSFSQLNIIKRNARRLLNLVNQLLDFRKMEEQELLLNTRPGDIVAFVSEVMESFRDYAHRKKIELIFNNHIHQYNTRFDHDKMERIIFNLLSNAFKFTFENGRISVEIDRMELKPGEEPDWITIKVIDTGIGIPPDKKEKIFENFYQNPTSPDILNQGTGIGLSITREFVKMHGGNIYVESEAGKGSQFIIELPLPLEENIDALPKGSSIDAEQEAAYIQGNDAGVTSALAEDYAAENPSILLVEDNDDFRYYLKDGLKAEYKILEANNGKEGWQKALALHPQLIVTDISMPFMNGIELCKKIKDDKRTGHIPVILLTALTGEEEQLKGLEIGANDYISKPFNFPVLHAKIKNLLALNQSLKTTYSKQIKVLAPEVKLESGDEKLMSDIMKFLEDHLTDTQLSVEGLSRHVGMSRSSLYNKLLELTGQTPVEFIRSVKLDKAAVLLEKSDMNIAQTAYSVGFATPNYFAKAFKAKFNMLPSEYASRQRKEGNKKEE